MKFELVKICLVGILLIGIISCNEKPILLDYCKMIADDQSYVNTDKSDIESFNADRAKRHKVFKRNFDLIMAKTSQDGFPFVSLKNYQSDSCKYWAVSMTMIHTAQSNPELFFGEKYSTIFSNELEKGNIEKKLLEQSSTITAKTIDLCEDLKADIEKATKKWGIEYSIFDEANFITCK